MGTKMIEKRMAAGRGQSRRPARDLEWRTPKGRDIGEVTRDAAGQVIDNYREALEKLRKH